MTSLNLPKIAAHITDITGLPASSLAHAQLMGRTLADLASSGIARITGADGSAHILAREVYDGSLA